MQTTNLPLGDMPLVFADGGPLSGRWCVNLGNVTIGRPPEVWWHCLWQATSGLCVGCVSVEFLIEFPQANTS